MATTPRTLHVRCATWDQVQTFYTRKLRQGRVLSMKVPFTEDVGAHITLGLELPNGLVIAIDGKVQRSSPIEGAADASAKTWIEIELFGFTEDVIGRIKEMASGSQQIAISPPAPPGPPPLRKSSPMIPMEELPADERTLFQHLSAELRRLRQLPVHEVLGVARDAGPDEIRRGWMLLVRKQHPDLVARRNAPAISHLAEELTIVANRAYDRLRAAFVAEERGSAFGPAISAPAGWLVGFEDLGAEPAAAPPPSRTISKRMPTVSPVAPPTNAPNPQGGEAFEVRARAMLGDGDSSNAQEVLAAALCVYPRSRPLRSLYYVASAIAALDKGEIMLATSQLETALAHHEQCTEAAVILEHLRKHGKAEGDVTRRLFR